MHSRTRDREYRGVDDVADVAGMRSWTHGVAITGVQEGAAVLDGREMVRRVVSFVPLVAVCVFRRVIELSREPND